MTRCRKSRTVVFIYCVPNKLWVSLSRLCNATCCMLAFVRGEAVDGRSPMLHMHMLRLGAGHCAHSGQTLTSLQLWCLATWPQAYCCRYSSELHSAVYSSVYAELCCISLLFGMRTSVCEHYYTYLVIAADSANDSYTHSCFFMYFLYMNTICISDRCT